MLQFRKFINNENRIKFFFILTFWLLICAMIFFIGFFNNLINKKNMFLSNNSYSSDNPYTSYDDFDNDINKITQLYIQNVDKFTTNDLIKVFDKNNYEYENIIKYKKVPNIYISSLPNDFNQISPTSKKKSLFIRSILPLIIKENEKIITLSKKLKKINDQFQSISRKDAVWLNEMLDFYNVKSMRLEDLTIKIDTIPVSIALGQAVIESGWGTSRFAAEGNALFGQWSWKKGTGIVPKEWNSNEKYEVKSFISLSNSVASYIKNLNTHPNYENFRLNRKLFRIHNKPLLGKQLYQYLNTYAADDNYSENLLNIIEANNFDQFENVKIQFIKSSDITSKTI